MTTQASSSTSDTQTFGRIGYDAYGEHPSAHGPWTTFDGRLMPTWEENSEAGPASNGAFTQERWEKAAAAIIEAYERRRLQFEASQEAGRIDPFLLGIESIASATRDLAAASASLAAAPDASGHVKALIVEVTKALRHRVSALASPPSEA